MSEGMSIIETPIIAIFFDVKTLYYYFLKGFHICKAYGQAIDNHCNYLSRPVVATSAEYLPKSIHILPCIVMHGVKES